jgi:hypothetical protein
VTEEQAIKLYELDKQCQILIQKLIILLEERDNHIKSIKGE